MSTMNNTTQMMNLTYSTTTTTTTTTTPGRSCVPGEEYIAVTAPPELLRLIPSFYPIKTLRQEEVALKISFYVLSMLLDVVGNSLVIFIVAASRKMRTPTNVLLVNLAVADLLIGVLCMWVHLGDSVTQEWPFGLGICKVNMFAQVTMITTSVLTLTVISIERFFAIVLPLRRGWTLRKTVIIIFVIWVIACSIACPQLHVRYLQEYQFSDHRVIICKEKWDEVYINENCDTGKPTEMIYHMFVAVVMFFVPIIVMIICYTVICVCLLMRKSPGTRSSSDNYSRSKRRVVRMLVVLLAVFIVCWTPVHVLELMPLLDTQHEVSDTVRYVAVYIAYLNSALNPVLYTGFNDNFRRGFQDVFRCGCFPFNHSRRVRPESRHMGSDARSHVPGLKNSAAVTAVYRQRHDHHDHDHGRDNGVNNKHRLQVTTIASTATTSFNGS